MVVRVTNTTFQTDGSAHWSTRTLAAYLGVGKYTVARIRHDHNLKS